MAPGSLIDLSKLAPCCPRCGYDLRGTVESWAHSCPLEGVCTECGLGFEWAELISDTVRKPRWSIEYCRRRQVPTRALATLACSTLPWTFWRDLRMSHEVRWRRVACHLAVIAMAIVAAVALSHAWYAWSYWRETVDRGANVKPTAWTAIGEPVLLPFAHDWVLARGVPKTWRSIGWSDYPTPREQLAAHFAPSARHIMAPMLPGVLMLMLMPAAFLLLPVSRKRAKVRWSHLARITCYSAALLLALALVALAAEAPYESRAYFFHRIHEWMRAPGWYLLVTLYLFPVLVGAWWFFAIRSYLRMTEPVALTLAVGLLAAVASHAIYLLVDLAIFL